MRSRPLARAWAGVKSSAGVWGRRQSPTTKKRLNRCQSSRVSVSDGQFSSGIITVMAGCGSSTSSAPQVAINFTSRGRRLSLQT
jgi:hypothetical protein